nr:uncharacterized protein LOC128688856 isoform X2 [Cherax quadricarinatus]XP_053632834.1 uncharacterized protein LOC128688856 isoform X2 [Cherax quadricarinatus]
MAVRAPSSDSLLSLYQYQSLPALQEPGLLRGPRRVARLCVFALVLPTLLITIPLYVRLVLYPPGHYPMMPTDQRLLSRHVSGIWCQAQNVNMNGSFNGYLSPSTLDVDSQRRTHVMINHLVLRDDIKEYWGFYLLRGSTITLSSCSRWDGAVLMVLRGVENLHRCAWIGELDSTEEEEEDDDVASNERHRLQQQNKDLIAATAFEEHPFKGEQHSNPEDDNSLSSPPINSEERRQSISQLLRKAIRISKDKSEILKILHTEDKTHNFISENQKLNKSLILQNNTKNSTVVPEMALDNGETQNEDENSTTGIPEARQIVSTDAKILDGLNKVNRKLKDETRGGKRRRLKGKRKRKKSNARDKNPAEEVLPEDEKSRQSRLKRFVDEEVDTDNGAFEQLDSNEISDMKQAAHNQNKVNISKAEQVIGGRIFFPEGLKFERGRFNQSTMNDNSREEHVSSYSSSEEALASCEGVILTLPLVPARSCNYHSVAINKIVYDIPVTGTYYFVFSSDNEIYVNDIFLNLTMQRVVYNIDKSEEVCLNTTECSMPLKFWSNEETVVEVPQETRWDHAYVLETKCEPRVYIYLTMILLVPLLIMCCAFR